jgi:hypothetical protein
MQEEILTIELDADHMHRHRVLALAVAMMVRRFARQSGSELEYVHHEWRLTPDDWLKVKFNASLGSEKPVCISVGLPETAIPPGTGLNIKAGRWPGWSRFWLRSAAELPVVENFLNAAFFLADSDYRKIYGKPFVRPGAVSVPPAVNAWTPLPHLRDGVPARF